MKARFQTACKTCGNTIAIGDEITWARRGQHKGTHHAACYQPQTKTESIETSEPNHSPVTPIDSANDSLERMLAKRIEPFIAIQRDEITAELEEKLAEMILDSIANLQKEQSTVYVQKGETLGTVNGPKHEHFDLLVQLIALRKPIYLWGEAGSGKSTAPRHIATMLGLPFEYIAIQAQMQESRLLGYMYGETYIETAFYRAYKNGGVFLIDELELGSGNLLGVLNGALANRQCAFPCGLVEQHPDFICIATGNTPANGADVAYSDRRKLDQSVRNRFAFVQWDTDKTLETHLATSVFQHGAKWASWVQGVRAYAKKNVPNLVVTQRDTITGAEYLSAGLKLDTVISMVVWRGIDQTTINAITSQHPIPVF